MKKSNLLAFALILTSVVSGTVFAGEKVTDFPKATTTAAVPAKQTQPKELAQEDCEECGESVHSEVSEPCEAEENCDMHG